MLTDTLTRELSGVGPEDVPPEEQLKKLRSTLELQVQKKSSFVIFVEGTVKKKKSCTLPTSPSVKKINVA